MHRYERTVEIDARVERVFDMFADFEAAPRWAGGVRDVWRTGQRTFRWVAATALDIDVEWEAEVVVLVPDRRLVWRSIGGDVRADCEAVFSQTPEGATLLRVVRGYETPGGRTGRAVARFFGRHPEEQLEEDLARFKRFAEGARREGRGDARDFRRRSPDGPAPGERDGGGRLRAYEESRTRHALTPREREREREREISERRSSEERRAAGWYLRRGVDRLLERPPEEVRRRRD